MGPPPKIGHHLCTFPYDINALATWANNNVGQSPDCFLHLEIQTVPPIVSSNLSLSPHLTCFDFRFMLTRQQVVYGLERVELRSTDLFIECPFRLALERNGWQEGPEGRQRPGGEPRCKGLDLLYRTADGTCNNLKHTSWGSSFMPFLRFLPPDYSDGVQVI